MNKRTLATGIIVIAVLVSGILWLRQGRGRRLGPLFARQEAYAKVKGPADAPVQIVEYSDFQCPACMKAQPSLNAILQEYPGKIRLTFFHYPLPMHPWAGIAHQAAECANRQGKFWEFHDRVYREQPVWSVAANASELLISYAKDAGVDLDAFGACLSNAEVTRKILGERARGQGLQVASTPTFFINGERVVGQAELDANGRNIIRKILGMPPLPPPKPQSAPAPAPSSSAAPASSKP